jgi:hypothetical protein
MAIDGPDDNPWWRAQQNVQTLPPMEVTGQRPYAGEPPQNESPMPTWPTPDSGGNETMPYPVTGGSGGFMDFIKGMFPGGQDGGFGFGGMNPNMIPWLATALNQYNNSGKYMDLATKYADKMNPFGDQRDFYKDRLRQLTENPNDYLKNSPDYQAAYEQGLGGVDRSLAMKGYAGSGTGAADVMRFGSQLGAQYLDRDRQSLMKMAGADIGPAAAAALISQGMKGSIDSQNNALGSLTAAFTKPDPRTTNPDGTTKTKLPDGVQKIISDAIKAGGPAGYAGALQALIKAGMSPTAAQTMLRQAGGGVDQGSDIGQEPGNGMVDTGDGWYDPDTGRYMDYAGNLIGNVGGPGEPGDAGSGGPIDDIYYDDNKYNNDMYPDIPITQTEDYGWLFGDMT